MYEIFEELIRKKNVSTYKVAKDTGISQTTFSNWKSGRSTPKADKLQILADYFGVDINYLMGNIANDCTSGYLTSDSLELAEFVDQNPEYHDLFEALKQVRPDDIDFVKQMIERVTDN